MLVPSNCLGHYSAETANMARLSAAALAECAMVDGVETGPCCGDLAVQLQAMLDGILSAYPDAKCFQNISVDIPAQARGRGGKRILVNLQQGAVHAEADARHVTLFTALLTTS